MKRTISKIVQWVQLLKLFLLGTCEQRSQLQTCAYFPQCNTIEKRKLETLQQLNLHLVFDFIKRIPSLYWTRYLIMSVIDRFIHANPTAQYKIRSIRISIDVDNQQTFQLFSTSGMQGKKTFIKNKMTAFMTFWIMDTKIKMNLKISEYIKNFQSLNSNLRYVIGSVLLKASSPMKKWFQADRNQGRKGRKMENVGKRGQKEGSKAVPKGTKHVTLRLARRWSWSTLGWSGSRLLRPKNRSC